MTVCSGRLDLAQRVADIYQDQDVLFLYLGCYNANARFSLVSDGLSLFSDVSSQASPVSSQDILVNNKIDDRTIDASATSVNDTSNMTTSWVTSLANHFSSFQWNPNVPHEQCNLGIKPEHFADLTLQGELAADMVEDESQTGNDIESMEYCFVDGIDDGGYTYRWYDRYT